MTAPPVIRAVAVRLRGAARTVLRIPRGILIPTVAVLAVGGLASAAFFGLAPNRPASQTSALHHSATPSPSSSPSPTPSSAPQAQPQPSATAPAPAARATSLALPRVPWYGGSAYYAKFPKAAASGWSDPSFFPISVFFGKPEQAKELASLGVNTYMGAEHDGSPIGSITSQGIDVIAQSEWTPAEVGNDPGVVGWHASDECEMGYSGCDSDDEHVRLATQAGYVAHLRSLNDGRFIQANFGNGVLGTYWASTTMAQQVALMDVSSVDKYAYTSPAVRDLLLSAPTWPKGANPQSAEAYGWLQDRMATFTGAAKPNWVFVETAEPYLTEAGASSITGGQIGGAVWNAIIHGAGGIAYFQHNNNGCGNYSLVDCSQALKDSVRSIDAEVKSLAPVINTQSYAWNFGPGIDASLKVSGGDAYVIAMATGGAGNRTFSLPPGVRGAVVTVVGENRTLPISGGRFTDSFAAEYSHHVYKISLSG